ncbi:hypothetical protein GCM10011488_41680 [Steroidobacter agaridevorans]|nr:hypothetical protein GCM10011488_41680 [Steroidobacter agaridevorans]
MRVATLVLGSLLLTHSVEAQTPIYRCAGGAGTVYSDRPCAADADLHEIDDSRVTVYTPAPADKQLSTKAATKPMKAKSPRQARLPDPAEHRLTCAKLEQSLRDVRTKMRTGYSAKQGERLKMRQRQLDQRRRLEKCG